MPEFRLRRTRAAYESHDPIKRLANVYLNHATGLIRDGRAAEAVGAIDEAVRLLESRKNLAPPVVSDGLTDEYA